MSRLRYMNRLQYLRKRAGLTQCDVAERLKVSQSVVSQWETGGCLPSIEWLPELAGLYDCSVDELLGLKVSRAVSSA